MPPLTTVTVDALQQYSRNAVWGTCAECPRDTSWRAYPEFCVNVNRYDHKLDIDELAQSIKRGGG